MRTVYDTNGNDVTSTALSFLRANRTLYMCDLVMMSSWIWWAGNAGVVGPQTMNFYWSLGDFPVQVGNVQTGPNTVSAINMWGTTRPAVFLPAAMDRGKLEYGIGFNAQTLDLTWYCGCSYVPVAVQVNMTLPGVTPAGFAPVSIPVVPKQRCRIDWLGGLTSPFYPIEPADRDASSAEYVCAFADAAGNLLSRSFFTSNSITIHAPVGASQLLLAGNAGSVSLAPFGFSMMGVRTSGGFPFPTTPTWQQAFAAGMFDECPVNLYRAFFTGDPKQGGTLLGTTLMFRGFVRQTEAAQDHVKMTLSSLLDLFQEVQVPTQLIQPGNRTTPYVPSGISYTASAMNVGLSTPSMLVFGSVSPSVADHALRDAYLITGGSSASTWVPQNGQPAPVFLRIRDNVTSGGNLILYLYEPTVIPLNALATEYFHGTGLGAPHWGQQPTANAILLQKPLSNSYGAPGFPSVPPPEVGI